MRRLLTAWLSAIALGWSLCSPGLHAQEVQRGYNAAPRSGAEDSGKTPALPYTVAAIFTILVMVIVCTPSRKLPVT